MPLSRRELKNRVLRKMSARTLQSILKFVEDKEPRLWGLEKTSTFVTDSVLVSLFKDLFAVGYHSLFESVKKWLPTSSHSLRHNTKIIRHLLCKWEKKRVVLSTLKDWKEAASYESFPKELKGVYL